MPASELLVYLSGGLNTANSPSDILNDQLSGATGMEYRPPRRGLFATRGRRRFDSDATAIGGNRIHGLFFCRFDKSNQLSDDGRSYGDYLVAFSNSTAYIGELTPTVMAGTAADFHPINQASYATTGLSSTATGYAGMVYFDDRYFFFNGYDKMKYMDGPTQPLSTNPATEFDDAGIVAATLTGYAIASSTVGDGTITAGTYQTWWSAVNDTPSNITEDEIGSYNGDPVDVTVSAGVSSFNIRLPTSLGSNDFYLYNTQYWGFWCTVVGGKYPNGFLQRSVAFSAYTVTALDTSVPYPTVGPLGGIAVSSNDEPPRPRALVVFQDSLVAIDSQDPRNIKYSMSGWPTRWPSVNYIPVNDEFGGDPTALAVCNNSLLVFSERGGLRVDDLPRSTDQEDMFSSRGRVKEPFSRSHGCVGPLAVATFNVFGSAELCLFVCRDGIHVTDGYKTDYASHTLDWYNTVDLANLYRSRMLNNPKYHRIEFYYVDKTDTTKWKRLDFYYHPKFMMDEGDAFPRLAVLGPTDVPGPAAAVGFWNNDWAVWTSDDAASTPHIWYEGTGLTDGRNLVDASGTINKSFTTKRFYPAGVDGEVQVANIYTHQSETTASGTATLRMSYDTADLGTYTASATVDFSLKNAQPHPALDRAQSFAATVEKNDGGDWQEINYIIFTVQGESRLSSAKSSA